VKQYSPLHCFTASLFNRVTFSRNNMLIPLSPVKFQRRPAKARPSKAAPSPVGPLTLVAASWDGSATLTLVFDRAVDLSSCDPVKIEVSVEDDAVYRGESASLVDPVTVSIDAGAFSEPEDPGTLLFAGSANGIVAVGDGLPWDGVDGLALPFP
jgi:hypothetical protein